MNLKSSKLSGESAEAAETPKKLLGPRWTYQGRCYSCVGNVEKCLEGTHVLGIKARYPIGLNLQSLGGMCNL